MKSKPLLIVVLVSGFLATGCVHGPAETIGALPTPAAVQPFRISSESMDAAEPSLAAGGNGSVYVAWVEHRDKQADVMVQRFDSAGKPSGIPARVNPQAGEATAWRGNPPSLAVSKNGTLYVAWTKKIDSPGGHAEDIYLSQSHDQGATFDTPIKVNDDQKAVGHGMQSIAVGPDDRIYVAWLDDRNTPPEMASHAPVQHHQAEANREVFLAVSDNAGRSFQSNKRIATNACPCCRTTISVGPDNRVYLSWRQVLPGDFRHIAVAHSEHAGEELSRPVIVSDDRWSIGGCPVSGAALSAGADGMLGVLWYTAGDAGPEGLYWSQSQDGGLTFEPRRLVYQGQLRGTPALVARNSDQLYAIWEGGNSESSPGVMMQELYSGSPLTDTTVLSNASSVPVGTLNGDRLWVAYVNTTQGKRNITFQAPTLVSEIAD
jgi:hypothetical protein